MFSGLIGSGLAIFVFLFLGSSYFVSRHKQLSAYHNGLCEVVEGEVVVLHQKESIEAHDIGDVIKIDDKEFIIDYTSTFEKNACGYKQTIVRGGVLRQGVYVRVHYYDEKILQIDVRKEVDE